MKKERKKSRSLTAWALIVAVVCMVPMLASCQKPLPTPEGKPLDRVQLMTATGELATVEYTVSKIIKAKDCTWWKIGEKRVLFKCNAYLQAGVDMTGYDDSKTRIDSSAEERQLLLQQGEQSILADVDSGKYAILADAERNTRIFFERMLTRLGYKSVTIKFEK